ncbi:amidohydrolase [Paenibacillus sp. LMG 31461]|uniref:Cyclic amide hydrolase n=1 Tax=Paenibacillus plantarum TaxID=2654975 RepID=A0ABX1XIL9_9BACL|nr:ring-opening amidohydrolase [Paenibacillus plantarum]NOU67700.1 amidohydrolase [Paenibacillus plantarum]
MNYDLIRCAMTHPGDVSELEKLLNTGAIQASEIKGIIAQTEGDGYARGYATLAFEVLLSERLGWSKADVFDRIPMMMIGKTGGLMSPHYSLFISRESGAAAAHSEKRFAFGVASTRALLPEEIGTLKQTDLVSEAVIAAMNDAGITDLADIHCVEIKCPWGVGGARSKASSALGVAVALGEVDREVLTESKINADHSLYSMKASVSAGQEQVACRVILMGNTKHSSSQLFIGSGMMADSLDLEGLGAALRSAGLDANPMLSKKEQSRVANVFVNCGADALGSVRDRRHTMHTDALSMHAGILAKAVANSVVGSFVGDTMILCSAGSEHQGPQGANLISVVVRAEEE